MGWYFSPQSRSELIAELIAPQETERASVKVIATGGLAPLFQSHADLFDRVEPDLTLRGITREVAIGPQQGHGLRPPTVTAPSTPVIARI